MRFLPVLVASCLLFGCSSNSQNAAPGGATSAALACPNVGDKSCPNDHPTTQGDVDVCNACHAEWSALGDCGAAANPTPSCGPDGKKHGQVPASCDAQIGAYLRCALEAMGGDAGHD